MEKTKTPSTCRIIGTSPTANKACSDNVADERGRKREKFGHSKCVMGGDGRIIGTSIFLVCPCYIP